MNMHEKYIIGVYDTENEAIQAIEDLKRQGYSPDEISVIGKNRDEVNEINDATGTENTKTEEGLATGAATGGALGGIVGILAGVGALAIPGIGPIIAAGPIAAGLTGAAVGAGAGGLAGALIGMGIPDDEANRYEGYVKEGKILILVDRHNHRSVDSSYDANLNQTVTGDTVNPADPNNPLSTDNTDYTRLNNTNRNL